MNKKILWPDVDVKFRTTLKGRYNAAVAWCPKCNKTSDTDPNVDYSVHFRGFAIWKDDVVLVRECMHCFEVWFHHVRDVGYYKTLTSLISNSRERNQKK